MGPLMRATGVGGGGDPGLRGSFKWVYREKKESSATEGASDFSSCNNRNIGRFVHFTICGSDGTLQINGETLLYRQ